MAGALAGGAEADDAKQALKDAASDEEPRAGAAGRVDLAAWLQRLPAHRELPLRLKDARLVVRLGVDENDGTAAASAGAGEVLEAVVNGVVEWHDGRLALQRLTAAAAGLELTLNGVVFPNPDVYALVVAHDLAEVRGALPDEQAAASPVHVWGRAAGEAWLAGSWRRPHAWGTVRLHDLRIAPGRVSIRATTRAKKLRLRRQPFTPWTTRSYTGRTATRSRCTSASKRRARRQASVRGHRRFAGRGAGADGGRHGRGRARRRAAAGPLERGRPG